METLDVENLSQIQFDTFKKYVHSSLYIVHLSSQYFMIHAITTEERPFYEEGKYD